MNHRTKRRTGMGAAEALPWKSRSVWLLISAMIAGLVLVASAPALFKHRSQRDESSPTRGTNAATKVPEATATATPDTGNSSADLVDTIDTDKSTDLQNQGNELLSQGKIDDAVAHYREAVKLNPEDEDAHYNLALALARQGHREDAKLEYREALRIYSDYAEAHNNLGNLLAAEGKLDEAIEHFQAALKTSPENASAQNNLGNALARQGKIHEAIPCFREALRLKPEYVEALYNLASAHLAQRRIDDAIAEFTEVLQRRPGFAPAQRGLQKARQLQSK